MICIVNYFDIIGAGYKVKKKLDDVSKITVPVELSVGKFIDAIFASISVS